MISHKSVHTIPVDGCVYNYAVEIHAGNSTQTSYITSLDSLFTRITHTFEHNEAVEHILEWAETAVDKLISHIIYSSTEQTTSQIPTALFNKLNYLGLIPNEVRDYNVGASNYSKHLIQPWTIWLDYPALSSCDHDIIKRILRDKSTEPRITDYEKVIHICNERIRQINTLNPKDN